MDFIHTIDIVNCLIFSSPIIIAYMVTIDKFIIV